MSAKARVLIIDDDKLVRATLRAILEKAGYEILEAPDGERGLKLFDTEPAALVITDIIMPDKEGVETIVDLRRRHGDVKIIAISGGGRTGNLDLLEVAKRLGADRTFNKPLDTNQLLAAVRELTTKET